MKFTTDRFLYGGDYNPDQWLERPDILEEDIRLMKKANVNTVSMAMFSWAKLEPEEGHYTFDWLETIINRLYANGISTILSTPSGARPHWLADRYPEVLRVNADRTRNIFGTRHNHCYTAESYRKKVHDIDYALAERFDHNPAVLLWHISNEFGGECHCPLCQDAFRGWLKKRYGTIAEVNRAWNASFWSHDYQSFEQIESPSPIGETSIHGLKQDWRLFVSDQTIDFCKAEIDAIREAGGSKPATTNMMYEFTGSDYTDFAKILDVVSWDNYPSWGKGSDCRIANDNAMQHDFMRALKHKPFLLMESCPGPTNWQPVSKLKRPGVLLAASLQATAHGSDSVLYFQIRKGRGGEEKFHGALIDHYGKEDDRTYQECSKVGASLCDLREIIGADTLAPVAVICDTRNRWALEASAGPRNAGLHYMDTIKKHYGGFRRHGVNVDIIDESRELSPYKIVCAPMTYMFRPGFADRVRFFTEQGGIFVLSYWSGVVDEHDLCILGGTPGGLMDVMGLRSTEIDSLYDGESNKIIPVAGKDLPDRSYSCQYLCQLLKTSTADTLMTYGEDFYRGTPALTVNTYGQGKAYYVAADAETDFFADFYGKLLTEAGIQCLTLPEGIEVASRVKNDAEYVFVQNFASAPRPAYVPENGELLFCCSEYMTPDGEVHYTDEAGAMMEAYESRVYRVKL